MNIAFFVSDHGFGHLMRNLPVMLHLLKETGHGIVLVTGSKHIALADDYFKQEMPEDSSLELQSRLKLISQHTDLGILVKPGTLQMDVEKMEVQLEEYIQKFDVLKKNARHILQMCQVDRVVVDIVPWALDAAVEEGLPVFLSTNFTWIEQYEGVLPERLIQPFRNSYDRLNACQNAEILLLELANEPTRKRFPEGIHTGVMCRPFHEEKVEQIRKELQKQTVRCCEGERSASEYPVVFLSIGGSNDGLDFDIDVSGLPYIFVSTGGLQLKGENVIFLPVETPNTQDYVMASDYCISKAGWSTLSEMMIAHKPMALLERPDVPEDCMNIAELVDRNAAIAITVDELKNPGAVIEQMKAKEWSEVTYENNYATVAGLITTHHA